MPNTAATFDAEIVQGVKKKTASLGIWIYFLLKYIVSHKQFRAKVLERASQWNWKFNALEIPRSGWKVEGGEEKELAAQAKRVKKNKKK